MIDKREARRKLMQVNKVRRNLLQPYFTGIGLTFGQGHARILESLLMEDHVTQKELADRCQMDVATMSRSLDRLEQSGFLVRMRDPSSRRCFLICLTEAGRKEAQIVRRFLSYMDDQTWKGFNPEEIQQFCGYMDRVLDNLNHAVLPDPDEAR